MKKKVKKKEGKIFCVKCQEETNHHYFMMFPVGYMVCNVCGEARE
jgi:late competence protein required for DNA uptake (superfamily II DNA/RNA helicase)